MSKIHSISIPNTVREIAIDNKIYPIELVKNAAELLQTLKAILPYAENEIESLQDLGRDDDDTMVEYQKASDILQSVYDIIKKAEGK